ncbi:MAG: hypothetical protein SFY81_12975 [Verrucomicrobiota bacterium]|nr:hypothetical protein [Verrucomicrobiota bacterium]
MSEKVSRWSDHALLAFTDADRWTPGIGDPSVMGWLTVAAYLFSSTVCLALWFQSKSDGSREGGSNRIFWLSLALLLFALGINKQLDLQTWLTLSIRNLAREGGWYEYRRILQGVFILGVALGGLLALGALLFFTRHSLRENKIPLAGAIFLGIFVLIRASSFHHVDQLLGFSPGGVKLNWVFELGGIGLIGLPAFCRMLRFKQRAPVWDSRNSARTSHS